MGEIIEQIYLALVGALSLTVFGGIALYIMSASYSRWRDFERHYATTTLPKTLAKRMAGAVRISQPGARWGHLSGDLKSYRHPPVHVRVHKDGLSLSMVQPFKFGHRDLFLPFSKMTVEPAAWDMLSNEYGIQMKDVEGIEIVMFSNIMQWAAEHSEVLDLMLQRAEVVRDLERAS
ncbi:hypothetical protein [Qipengyuania sp. S6317L1]|uniref:hypothetical protein n=1 Tax=Qipengyuania sp. S6317L1 TaxID=2926410 RepID=UPI001FF148AF|nr:hypothetical protein [Qipengyuania sp. S6317L1]